MKKQLLVIALLFTGVYFAQENFNAESFIQSKIASGDIKAPKLKKGVKAYKSSDVKKLTDMVNGFIKEGADAYTAQNFKTAAEKLEAAYLLNDAVTGVKDTARLYFAGIASVQAKTHQKSVDVIGKLIDLGYTGIKKEYVATNAEGKEVVFGTKTEQTLATKDKTNLHTNPIERNSENEQSSLYYYLSYSLDQLGNADQALVKAEEGFAKFPQNTNLSSFISNAYYKQNRIDEFVGIVEKSLAKDPNNADLLYNLGVAYNKIRAQAVENEDSAKELEFKDKAIAQYTKALEIDPDYVNAYVNLSALILTEEQQIVDQINELPYNAAGRKKQAELEEVRKGVFNKALPYLEKAMTLDSNNTSVLKTLKEIYYKLEKMDLYNQVKEKLNSLK